MYRITPFHPQRMGRVGFGLSAVVVWAIGAGCASPTNDFCGRRSECFVQSCKFSSDVCGSLAEGLYNECVARNDSLLTALKDSGNGQCSQCAETIVEVFDCMADTRSCSEFNLADKDGGICYGYIQARKSICDTSPCEDYGKVF